jgi:hypothetical protein
MADDKREVVVTDVKIPFWSMGMPKPVQVQH